MSVSYIQLDLLFACAGFFLCYLYYNNRRSGPRLPPGPKPLPIIGNLWDIPKAKAWEKHGKWAKEYGDIVYLRSFGGSIIIVNTFKAACDLLEKRSTVYSGRPFFTMFNELMGFGAGTAAQPYGKVWRKHRTVYRKELGVTAVQRYHARQMDATRGLLRSLLESPENYRQHLRHMAAGVVMSIAYGHDIYPENDPFVALAESNAYAFTRGARPGAYLVDLIPMLKHVPEWVPGAGFQRFARETRENVNNARNVPFADVKRRLAAGTAQPSFVANALAELGTMDDSNEDIDLVKLVAGSIYGAGSDTTVSAIHSFILAMILYPAVQKKAQAELDAVVGKDRLPQFSDRPHLPYMAAVVKEVFRWHPVAPSGLPHATTEDDIYEDYYIPKGAVVIANSWGILHDPDLYADPLTFRPERFIPDKDGKFERDPAITGAFGFGRRICAGRHLADASVWIAAASLLAAFDITNAVDENGRDIDVSFSLDPAPSLLIHPRPFPCSIKPRSKEAEALIRQTEQTCQA